MKTKELQQIIKDSFFELAEKGQGKLSNYHCMRPGWHLKDHVDREKEIRFCIYIEKNRIILDDGNEGMAEFCSKCLAEIMLKKMNEI